MTVAVEERENIRTISLNRPERRNSFNSQTVTDLTQAFEDARTSDVRVVVLTGEGTAFSAGADLEYMSTIKNAGEEANLEDARALANLMRTIYTFPKPVVARVNGAAIGGGVGLVAACDIALASQNAIFAFSEVRLGLVPAVIGPYVVKKIGESNARRYMLTGDRFNAETARQIGLVHQVSVQGDFNHAVDSMCVSLALTGPEAVNHCKDLIKQCAERPEDDLVDYTTSLIAKLRASDEGQEGMGAFLEKRDPRWQIASE